MTPTYEQYLKIFDEKRLHAFFSSIRLDRKTECWEWTGATDRSGYGQVYVKGSLLGTSSRQVAIPTHCLMMVMVFREDIPGGIVVRHQCNIRRCCNPEHLEFGTSAQNSADSWDNVAVNRHGKLRRKPWKNAKKKFVQYRYHPDRTEWLKWIASMIGRNLRHELGELSRAGVE